MGKNVYSLILAEDVVALVDALAAREGYSRSALVNHILAQYVSMVTPEQANRQALQALQLLACAQGLRPAMSAGGALSLKTALPYRYNPALSYTVELWGEGEGIGRLRVSLRGQSEGLLAGLGRFFALWQSLESSHLPHPPAAGDHQLEGPRYRRTLRQPATHPGAETGEAIARYIALMDHCIKTYFKLIDDLPAAARQTEALYLEGLEALGEGRAL